MAPPKKYPLDQEVECALCGEPDTRTVLNQYFGKKLHFCCIEHRKEYNRLVKEGSIEKQPPLACGIPVSSGDWGNLGLNPRRDIKDMRSPTEYEGRFYK